MRIRVLARTLRELYRGERTQGKRLEALHRLGQELIPGYRFSWPYPDWWKNESFNQYLKQAGEEGGYNTQRRWAAAQLLRLVSHLPGDTAECGVYRGATSKIICHANTRSPHPKHHHMFDSFEGISEPHSEDGEYWHKHDLTADEQMPAEMLQEYPDKTFYKGWIPDRFDEVADRRFSFVHVDVDLYEPTLASLQFFYERMEPHAIFLCDDYHAEFCPGATKACDQFMADKVESMIGMPAAGGFFIKGWETADELYADPAA